MLRGSPSNYVFIKIPDVLLCVYPLGICSKHNFLRRRRCFCVLTEDIRPIARYARKTSSQSNNKPLKSRKITKDVQKFLVVVGFYRNAISKFPLIALLLT
uniref:Ovule protein n=1 Tax=Strongyloides venezuelensis TaxID=75913 RepID=A0A0K0FPE9_STRVS